ncbi:MAG: acyl carrier protein [Arcobacteraceae bacterium]|nr:acyl carrier protein [Arcobacteraceae bacterium]
MVSNTELKEVLIKYLNLEDIETNEIDDNDPLFGDVGLGLDSVDSIELVLAIEKEYGVKITDSTKYDTIFATISSLLTYINDNKK